MATTNVTEVKRLSLTVISRTHRYGPADPRTVKAAQELAEARADAAEAEATRLRALADAMAVAS
jgi:uncharacterized membrane protein YqiK